MNKSILVFLLLVFVMLSSFAQEPSQRVQLKTGEVITGTVLENVEGKVLKLRINEKDVRSFKWEEIDTMYFVAAAHLDEWQETTKMFSTMRLLKDKGYSGVYNLGIFGMFGSSTEYAGTAYDDLWSGSNAYEGVYFHFDMSHGYQFNPHFAFRVGGAVEYGKAFILPVYGEVQFTFRKRLFSPIVVLSPGYAWCSDRDYYNKYYTHFNPLERRGGGFYFTGNLGFRYSFDTYSAVQVTLGLRYQSVSDDEATARIYGMNLRVGFEF